MPIGLFVCQKITVSEPPIGHNRYMKDDCPIDCPNRGKEAPRVKAGCYLFALIASLFLAYQAVAHERRNEPVPPTTWMPILVVIGVALGVNIDPSKFLGK